MDRLVSMDTGLKQHKTILLLGHAYVCVNVSGVWVCICVCVCICVSKRIYVYFLKVFKGSDQDGVKFIKHGT